MLEIIKKEEEKKATPTLLLHTCCAPCSTTVLKRLANNFKITVFYYNPNIDTAQEYVKRKEEQIRFIKEFKSNLPITILDCDYDKESFTKMAKGLENEPERGKRCYNCYQLRLEKTAQMAKEHNFDYFATTLSVSPYKVSSWLNEIGSYLENKYQISFLYSDFKKENGYLESIELSKKYHLYRQNYCGCYYSKKEKK